VGYFRGIKSWGNSPARARTASGCLSFLCLRRVGFFTVNFNSMQQTIKMARNQKNTATDKTSWIRTALLTLVFIAAIPLVILSIIYAVDLKHTVEGLKKVNDNLLSQVTQQKQLMEQQHQLMTQQLEINKSMLAVAQQQLDTARGTLAVVQSSDAKLNQSLALQQQLLGVAQATLQQAQEINRKMPPSINIPALPSGLPIATPSPALPL
jgi:hypothetical protein